MFKYFKSKGKSDIEVWINKSLNDARLCGLMQLLGGDWQKWAKSQGVSTQSINLMKQLDSQYSKVSNAKYRIPGGGGSKINPADLAKWLVLRAQKVGSKAAYSSLKCLAQNPCTSGYHVTLINGLDFTGTVNFGDDIKLVSGNFLPQDIQDGISQKIARMGHTAKPPYSFLFKPVDVDVFSDEPDEHDEAATQNYVDSEFVIVNFLSLFSKRHAPCIDRRWSVLSDSTPMSGIIDNGYQGFMEIRPPKVPENWDDVDLEQLPEIYKAYRQIPEKQRLPIDIALWRRSQAMNTWDDTNKAIDLGIALESVLTSPKTREQLSLHIRVLGSKLVSKDSNERSEIFLLLKCLYRIRSEAVHNGTVDKSYKIKNRGSVRTSEVLDEGIALLSRCIKEIIKRGGLTQDDFEALLIE
ncbi:HEPN domain-containing protein [Pseudidiomarina sediminum]|uniref:HEPN domain-containing protein n=1 Tax=Pseudidiomarina sediminum TaxID=431675 RepID=UPI001C979AE8|nr:hypothetical protein [Pseudidiomarina sediminum]